MEVYDLCHPFCLQCKFVLKPIEQQEQRPPLCIFFSYFNTMLVNKTKGNSKEYRTKTNANKFIYILISTVVTSKRATTRYESRRTNDKQSKKWM